MNVALVLNPKTGLVSPQFHVVFNDDFTTVTHLRKGTVPPNWAKLVANSGERSTEEFYDLTKTWFEQIPDESAGEVIDPISPENEGADNFSISSNDSIPSKQAMFPREMTLLYQIPREQH